MVTATLYVESGKIRAKDGWWVRAEEIIPHLMSKLLIHKSRWLRNVTQQNRVYPAAPWGVSYIVIGWAEKGLRGRMTQD